MNRPTRNAIIGLGLGLVMISIAAPRGPLATVAAAQDSAGGSSQERLTAEMTRLMEEVTRLRQELADARLRASDAERELAELRQFIHDHDEFSDDFERYAAIKEITERETRRQAAEDARLRREQEKADRLARRDAARAERDRERAEDSRLDRYRRAGFAHIGLDIFAGRMAYSYSTTEHNGARVDYDPLIGHYYRPLAPHTEIDYSEMTISGSVLNATTEIRNIGIAITFFDDNGNQVGGETVQISNARPDVPYPFTSTIAMALNRAFSSSTTYVLYADAVSAEP